MLFIDGQLHGYDMTRHPLRDLLSGDDYTSDAVIPNPTIPAQAESRRRMSTEDISAWRIDSNETGEAHYVKTAGPSDRKKVIGKMKRSQRVWRETGATVLNLEA